jgi:hypothetical protein
MSNPKNPYLRAALAREVKAHYRIADRRVEYEADWTARPFRSPVTPENQNVLHAVRNFALVDEPPLVFNWAARRDPVWLVSGDLPRVALATIHAAEGGQDPQHLCLGDVRIRLTLHGESFWLDERGEVRTRYQPWGTRHAVQLDSPANLSVTVDAFLAENRGIAVRTSLAATEGVSVPVTLEYVVGAVRFDPSCAMQARYLRSRPDEYPWHIPQRLQAADRIECRDETATITNPDAPYSAWLAGDVTAESGAYPFGDETREFVVYRHAFTATAEPRDCRLLVGKVEGNGSAPVRMEHFAYYETEARRYYQYLLDACRMETPDEALDAGFHSAVVNLDYEFHDFAWLEGVHQWNCFWANNYQIRAALLLGQTERAREALIALATRAGGPGQERNADGAPFGNDVNQDALPYYLVSLWRYWRATEDRDTLRRVWPDVTRALALWLEHYDPDHDGLLHWHRSVNSFMYQGDHHRLPGAGFSPSVMAAFDLDCMAEMAEGLGGEAAAPAAAWRRRAVYIRAELLRRLWLPAEGRFAGCMDLQGHRHHAVYYTDFAFPVLFADYPEPIKWLTILAMDRMLSLGEDLLRTGTLKPDHFGNNVPHITSNCEGAEACFALGRAERGTALLRGAARASTIFTHSPGAVPEYMGMQGEGLPDYIFGPPTGSLLLGILRGLWGVERVAAGQSFEWQPCLPAVWEQALLRLPGIAVGIRGGAAERTYFLQLAEAHDVRLRLPLFGRQVAGVTDGDGKPLPHRIEAHPSGGFVWVECPAACEHVVCVALAETLPAVHFPPVLRPGATVEVALPAAGWRLRDPQRVFAEFAIDGTMLRGRVAEGVGDRTLFLEDPAIPAVYPVAVAVQAAGQVAETEPQDGPLFLEGVRTPVSLDAHINDNIIPVLLYQPYGIPRFVEGPPQQGLLPATVGPYCFQVRDLEPRLVRIEVGGLVHHDAWRDGAGARANELLLASHTREALRLPVGRPIRGIEVLCLADAEVRQTGMPVAEGVFTYADGFEERLPLVYGRELDHPAYPFATHSAVQELPGVPRMGLPWFVQAFTLPARPDRVLDRVEIRVTALTTTLGIFAVNLVTESETV